MKSDKLEVGELYVIFSNEMHGSRFNGKEWESYDPYTRMAVGMYQGEKEIGDGDHFMMTRLFWLGEVEGAYSDKYYVFKKAKNV